MDVVKVRADNVGDSENEILTSIDNQLKDLRTEKPKEMHHINDDVFKKDLLSLSSLDNEFDLSKKGDK